MKIFIATAIISTLGVIGFIYLAASINQGIVEEVEVIREDYEESETIADIFLQDIKNYAKQNDLPADEEFSNYSFNTDSILSHLEYVRKEDKGHIFETEVDPYTITLKLRLLHKDNVNDMFVRIEVDKEGRTTPPSLREENIKWGKKDSE